ncbi:uncharacterized protein [Gossypium hirsutum]|uniref:DNA/RNA polymerases superfamily protein n=1 Tax=Gossypium hirsutum TaxID=3635 RepID=A0A1U8NVN1_GOSHI|nr:uncharacterized protein LOC107952251 [Gossypium hirsutum]
MVPYEELYGHMFHTPLCWTELGERHVLGPELVSKIEDKVILIRDRLKVAFDKQKSYTDLRRCEIEYSVGDFVFLKVSPWKKILRFDLKENVVRSNLTFEEEPAQVLERNVKVLRRKSIPLLKVL